MIFNRNKKVTAKSGLNPKLALGFVTKCKISKAARARALFFDEGVAELHRIKKLSKSLMLKIFCIAVEC
jgi:hypothetical protein